MINIKECINNTIITDFFVVKSVTKEVAKNKSNFLNIIIGNKICEITCRLWDSKDSDYEFFKSNDIVKIQGSVNEYQGNKQLIINKYRSLNESDNIDINELIETSTINPNLKYNFIYDTAHCFKNETLKKITTKLLEKYKELILKVGAAKVHHHNIVYGWLEHTSTMLSNGNSLVYNYSSNINVELLQAGIILHDIGKIKEFKFKSYGIVEDYTIQGELLGHISIGLQMLSEISTILKYEDNFECDEYTMTLLSHLILSHHGQPEYGSPKYPMTKEAELLSTLDMLDTKMYMFDKIIKETDEDSFSKRQWSLDNRKIYSMKK